jgi:hypothetical protein
VVDDVAVLVYVRGFIKATVSSKELQVYRSPHVKDSSEVYKPVKAVLDSKPHRIVLTKVIEDENMMFREGLFSVYQFTD